MFNTFKEFIEKNLYLTIVIIFSFMVSVFLLWYGFGFDEKSQAIFNNEKDNFSNEVTRQLDGVYVKSGQEALKPIIVMIENHYDSRPVSGLEDASIVYETIIEGDITRLLAIFDPTINTKRIGPVRSARPFFVDIATEWNGVYFHAGGSPEALEQLKVLDLDRINEISADGIFFWRDNNRFAPHNLFTSSNLIQRAINAKEFATSTDFTPWLFKDGKAADVTEGEEIEIEVPFSGNDLYYVTYKYNQDDNNYTRYLNGEVHKTGSGIILKTDNIIKQFVDSKVIDSYGRRYIDLETGGKATIYKNGEKIEGYWEKIKGRTKFFDNNDKEIEFNRGRIWVELLFN